MVSGSRSLRPPGGAQSGAEINTEKGIKMKAPTEIAIEGRLGTASACTRSRGRSAIRTLGLLVPNQLQAAIEICRISRFPTIATMLEPVSDQYSTSLIRAALSTDHGDLFTISRWAHGLPANPQPSFSSVCFSSAQNFLFRFQPVVHRIARSGPSLLVQFKGTILNCFVGIRKISPRHGTSGFRKKRHQGGNDHDKKHNTSQ